MKATDRLRGQPLAVLVCVLGGWILLRALTWQAPDWHRDREKEGNPPIAIALAKHAQEGAVTPVQGGPVSPAGLYFPAISPVAYWQAGWHGAVPLFQEVRVVHVLGEGMQGLALAELAGRSPHGNEGGREGWAAALARLATLEGRHGYTGQSVPAAPAPVPMSPGLKASGADRWSADSWMLLRRNGQAAFAAGRPLYGGSQAGAVLRYHLAPSSARQPIAYLRGSQALGGISESEAAIGLGARPFPRMPLMVAGEARMFRSGGKTSFRPAALAYTQLPPFNLSGKLRGEAYLQGGYVGGRFATGFVDGQLRVDRPAFTFDDTIVRLGGGLWGGAQKGAERLDIGPGASAALDIAGTPSRVSMDWRFRLAGKAEPGSGPAITLSAGF